MRFGWSFLHLASVKKTTETHLCATCSKTDAPKAPKGIPKAPQADSDHGAPWCLSRLRFPIPGLQEFMRVDYSLAPVLLAVSYTGLQEIMRVDYSLVPVLLAVSYTWALRNHACGRLLGACPACGFLYLGSKKSCGWTTVPIPLLCPSPIPLRYLSHTPPIPFLYPSPNLPTRPAPPIPHELG